MYKKNWKLITNKGDEKLNIEKCLKKGQPIRSGTLMFSLYGGLCYWKKKIYPSNH